MTQDEIDLHADAVTKLLPKIKLGEYIKEFDEINKINDQKIPFKYLFNHWFYFTHILKYNELKSTSNMLFYKRSNGDIKCIKPHRITKTLVYYKMDDTEIKFKRYYKGDKPKTYYSGAELCGHIHKLHNSNNLKYFNTKGRKRKVISLLDKLKNDVIETPIETGRDFFNDILYKLNGYNDK